MPYYLIRFNRYRPPEDSFSNTIVLRYPSLSELRRRVFIDYMDTPEFRRIAAENPTEDVKVFEDTRSEVIYLGRLWLDQTLGDGSPASKRPMWRPANAQRNYTVSLRDGELSRRWGW